MSDYAQPPIVQNVANPYLLGGYQNVPMPSVACQNGPYFGGGYPNGYPTPPVAYNLGCSQPSTHSLASYSTLADGSMSQNVIPATMYPNQVPVTNDPGVPYSYAAQNIAPSTGMFPMMAPGGGVSVGPYLTPGAAGALPVGVGAEAQPQAPVVYPTALGPAGPPSYPGQYLE